MGFYGNIKNTSRTQFQFDKIYANRAEMDLNCGSDGVYAGRYVLIEYDQAPIGFTLDDFVSTSNPYFQNYDFYCVDGNMYSSILAAPFIQIDQNTLVVPPTDSSIEGIPKGSITVIKQHHNIYDIGPKAIQYKQLVEDSAANGGFRVKSITRTEYDTLNTSNETHYLILENGLIANSKGPGLGYEDWVKDQAVCILAPGYQYSTNEDIQYWMLYDITEEEELVDDQTVTKRYYQWTQLTNDNDSPYQKNFAFDTASYTDARRGYDSTVWQKVFTAGREKYVMIAELNSVVPTFGLAADAPKIVPTSPHFDTTSTNIYYLMHMSASWGARIKAANPDLVGPYIHPNGLVSGDSSTMPMRNSLIDKKLYPSDVKMQWTAEFPTSEAGFNDFGSSIQQEQYNPEASEWMVSKDGFDIDAAIYFNKDGFSSNKVAYSLDIIDPNQANIGKYNANIAQSGWKNTNEIQMTASGQSGHVYNQHNGSIDMVPQIDTQEFSVMLPALGDAVAEMWDLIYGGRKTNESIAASNRRNQDIAWEDAQIKLSRRGLRLVGQGNGKDPVSQEFHSYNKAAVNTISGAINTVHDLIGMIITPASNQSLQENISALDENRIYFNSTTNEYMRKHLTYIYEPEQVTYQYNQVTDIKPEQFIPDLYYVIDPETDEYVPAAEYLEDHNHNTDYDPSLIYYEKGLETGEDFTLQENLQSFDGNRYLYQDFNGSTYALNEDGSMNPRMADYISDPQYHPEKKYFEIDINRDLIPVTLSDGYEPKKYFYRTSTRDFLIENGDVPDPNRDYFILKNPIRVTDYADGLFDGIYIPGVYYYKQNGAYYLDRQSKPTHDEYYLPAETQAELDENGNAQLYHKITRWERATEVNAETYVKGVYYIGTLKDGAEEPVDGVYTTDIYDFMGPSYDAYRTGVTYFIKTVELIPVTDNQVIINEGEKYHLTAFYTDTFYRQILDPVTGLVSGYSLVKALSEIDPISADTQDQFFVFGANPNPAPNAPFRSAVNFNYAEPYGIIKVTEFYSPHIYHYINGRNIILDNYSEYSTDNAPYYYFKEPIYIRTSDTTVVSGKDYYKSDNNELTYEKIINPTGNPTTQGWFELVDPGFDPEPVEINFYQSHTYYTPVTDASGNIIYKKDSDGHPTDQPADYTLVTTDSIPDNIPLYTREQYYVYEDKAGVLKKGSAWNPNALLIPPTVTLAKRSEKYELQVMQGFARNLNTIIGLILKLNSTIEINDLYTRDERNANGMINKMNDIVAFFGKVKPLGITIADDYGRITSADWSTMQDQTASFIKNANDLTPGVTDKGVKSDIYPIAEKVSDMRQQWLTLNVNGDVWNPKITLHHNFQPVKSTTSSSNMNIATPFYISAGSENNANDSVNPAIVPTDDNNKILLYTPKVDAMGHVVGNNVETKTLPYSYRAFNLVNEVDHGTDLVDSGSTVATTRTNGILIADTTQDLMTITAANKWIAFVANPTNDSFTIGHKLHSPNAAQTEARITNKNADNVTSNSDNDKIVLHDIVWDAAGHMLEDHPNTYTLPYGFKFVSTSAASEAVTDLTHTAATIAAENTQDTVTFKPANIWMKLSVDATDDSVTFGHLVREITTSAKALTDLNIGIGDTVENVNNQINIQDITHDEAGHIRSRQDHVYTLPFNFKFITTTGTTGDPLSDGSTTITAAAHTSNITTAALNTQDILTINPGNAWIKVNVNQNDRTIKLYHYVAAIDKADVNSGTATDFNNVSLSNGVFSLKDITHDDAGHITAYKTHNYVLPYSFKTFTHSNNAGVTDVDLQGYTDGNHNIIAATVTDTFNIASQNKWIRLKADENTKTLTFSHLTNNFNPTTTTGSLSDETNGKTFETISITKDEAGHLTSLNTHTWTMPNSFGKITVGAASTNNTTVLTSVSSTLEAECTHDTVTFTAGDRWIIIAGDSDNDKVTIGHAEPDKTSYVYDAGQSANATLNHGGKFKVVHPQADKFGHIGALTEYEITLPTLSLGLNANNTSVANVLTGITLNATTGAFEYTQQNVSELQLTNFSYTTNQSNDDIVAGITINEAFARLQKKIYDETTATTGARDVAIQTAIEGLDSSLSNSDMNKTLTGITIQDGKITTSTFGNIAITANQVTVDETTNFDSRYYTETEIDAKIEGLDGGTFTGTPGANSTITVLSEVDGQVSATFEPIEIECNQISDLEDNYYKKTDTFTYTSAGNQKQADTLDLINRIEVLENTIRTLIPLIPDTVISLSDKENLISLLEYPEEENEPENP